MADATVLTNVADQTGAAPGAEQVPPPAPTRVEDQQFLAETRSLIEAMTGLCPAPRSPVAPKKSKDRLSSSTRT